MRIPVYEQQRSVSAPQVRATEIAKPLDLSKAVDFVENRYEQGLKEKEQGDKLFAANEMSRVDIALQQKYAEIEARIADGGDYAEAEKEYAEFFNETTNESMQRFGSTDMRSAGVKLDYEKTGVEYGLRLKGSVRNRAKADAADNFNMKIDLYGAKISNAANPAERGAIAYEVSSEISKAVSLGVMSADEGELKLRTFITNSVNDYADNRPLEFIKDAEANPEKYAGIANIEKKVQLAKIKVANFETQAVALQQYNTTSSRLDQLQRAMDGTLTAKDMEDTESPVIKALATKTKRTTIPAADNAAALIKYDNGIDELNALMQQEGDPKKILSALDEYQTEILADAGKSITGAQAAALVKTSQNLFFSKNTDGSINQWDFAAPEENAAIFGIGQPTKLAFKYLDETIPATLAGADRVRYKLAFSDAFERNLNKDGEYAPSWDYSKDNERVQSAIMAAQKEVAMQRNPALLGVEGTPNRIIGSGKDEPVSGAESTAKAKREVQGGYKDATDKVSGAVRRYYDDGTFEDLPPKKSNDPQQSQQPSSLMNKINYTSRDNVSQELMNMGLRKEAVAGILGNIHVETGGTFDPSQKQIGGGKGHGLFQFDFMKSHYDDWRGGKPDNTETQLAFMQDIVYGDSQNIIGKDNATRLRKSFETGTAEEVAVDFMEIFERPGKPHKERRVQAAKQHLQEI